MENLKNQGNEKWKIEKHKKWKRRKNQISDPMFSKGKTDVFSGRDKMKNLINKGN